MQEAVTRREDLYNRRRKRRRVGVIARARLIGRLSVCLGEGGQKLQEQISVSPPYISRNLFKAQAYCILGVVKELKFT